MASTCSDVCFNGALQKHFIVSSVSVCGGISDGAVYWGTTLTTTLHFGGKCCTFTPFNLGCLLCPSVMTHICVCLFCRCVCPHRVTYYIHLWLFVIASPSSLCRTWKICFSFWTQSTLIPFSELNIHNNICLNLIYLNCSFCELLRITFDIARTLNYRHFRSFPDKTSPFFSNMIS